MIAVLLDFISKKNENFNFWFVLLKEFYLSALYPKIFQDLGISYKTDDTGFAHHCPYEIQCLLIEKFSTLTSNSSISKVLWDPSNGPITLEILRQSASMPLKHHENIKKALDAYKSWLLDPSKVGLFGEKVQEYWQTYLRNMLALFYVKSTGEEIANHVSICKHALSFVSTLTVELAPKLTNETWESFQTTLLNTVTDFFTRMKTAPGGEQGLVGAADALVHTLFFVWIKSTVTTKEMWGDFQGKISALITWKAVVSQWKEKVVQLTYILKDFIYNVNQVELLVGPKKGGKVSTNIQRDPKLDAINWDQDRITEIWFIMLDILGNINKIPDPINYEIAMTCQKEIIELLMQAEYESLPYDGTLYFLLC